MTNYDGDEDTLCRYWPWTEGDGWKQQLQNIIIINISIEYNSSCIATCVTLHHRSSAQLSGRTMMAGTKIWNISNFMIKHSSITSCTTFVLVVKYFQAQRFYPNISDFWNSTPAAPDTSLLQRWSMMRVAGSAVKRSIGFTISFRNHGEDPY